MPRESRSILTISDFSLIPDLESTLRDLPITMSVIVILLLYGKHESPQTPTATERRQIWGTSCRFENERQSVNRERSRVREEWLLPSFLVVVSSQFFIFIVVPNFSATVVFNRKNTDMGVPMFYILKCFFARNVF